MMILFLTLLQKSESLGNVMKKNLTLWTCVSKSVVLAKKQKLWDPQLWSKNVKNRPYCESNYLSKSERIFLHWKFITLLINNDILLMHRICEKFLFYVIVKKITLYPWRRDYKLPHMKSIWRFGIYVVNFIINDQQ